MHIPRIAIIVVMTAAVAAAGCRCRSACCLPATPQIACNLVDSAVADAAVDLTAIVPDCESVDCKLQPLPRPEESYRMLTPEECQCRAAANANLANLVVLEEHWASVIIECDSEV